MDSATTLAVLRWEQNFASRTEFRINTTTANGQTLPSAAMDADGDFVVTWESRNQDGLGLGVYGQRYNAAGVPQGGEFRVNTTTFDDQARPSVAINADGDFVVTWQSESLDGSGYGIYAQRYNALGVPQGDEFQVNTTVTNDQIHPSVDVTPGGDFIVTWSSQLQDSSGWGVYGQRFDSAGNMKGTEFRVNSTTTSDQNESSVAILADGDFLVS